MSQGTCHQCGKAMTGKSTGRPAKTHAACRSAYRAAQKRAKRLDALMDEADRYGITVEQLQAEREQRKIDAWERKLDAIARKSILPGLRHGGLLSGGEGTGDVRGGVAPRVGRTVQNRGSRPVSWRPDGKYERTADWQRPVFAHRGLWRRLMRKAAISASATTAEVHERLSDIWGEIGVPVNLDWLDALHAHEKQAALDWLRDLAAEPPDELDEEVAARERLADVESAFHDALEGVARCAVDMYAKTGDMAILEATTAIPGLERLSEFRAATVVVEGETPTREITPGEALSAELAARLR